MANEKGFTFVEVLFAAALLVIAILSMMTANTYVRQANEASAERLIAFLDAQNILEQMRTTASTIEPQNFPTNVVSRYQRFQFTNLPAEQLTVTYADPTADPLDALLTVTWQSRGIRGASIQLRSLITTRNVQ